MIEENTLPGTQLIGKSVATWIQENTTHTPRNFGAEDFSLGLGLLRVNERSGMNLKLVVK